MALGIMILNMLELGRFAKRRHIPVQVAQPVVDGRVAGADVADVAFEVLDVDGVEADEGRVEADVGFGEVRAVVVGCGGGGVRGEVSFDAREGGEEGVEGFFVGGLRSAGLGGV